MKPPKEAQVLIPQDQREYTGIFSKLFSRQPQPWHLSNAHSVFNIPLGFAKSKAESQALHFQGAVRSSSFIIPLPRRLGPPYEKLA